MKNKEYLALEKWLLKKGYSVNEKYNAEDMVCFETKKVYINSRQTEENKLFALLHEAGHVLIHSNIDSFLEKHPIYPYLVIDNRKQRSRIYRVCLISEELEAWKKGLLIAKKIKIKIDKEKYYNQMVKSVWTYIKWSSS